MKRRNFLKTTLMAIVAAYSPISLKQQMLVDEDENPKNVYAMTLDLGDLFEKYGLNMNTTLGCLSDRAFENGKKLVVELDG